MATDREIGAISVRIAADTGDLTRGLARARQSVVEANQSLSDGLRTIEDVTHTVFDGFSRTLESAATNGRVTMRDMVDSILADLQRLAVKTFISGPLEGVFSSILGSALNFGGARATGGAVSPNHAFLVGERGPELFVPGQSGTVIANGRGISAPSIVFNVQAADAHSFLRSETQIAAMVARAAARGQRNL